MDILLNYFDGKLQWAQLTGEGQGFTEYIYRHYLIALEVLLRNPP